MNILLIFFALPIAVIIISIALQKILKCPILVAAIIFAIFLIVTFIVNNLNLLIAAIAYAIISFITAYITCIIGRIYERMGNECRNRGSCVRDVCNGSANRTNLLATSNNIVNENASCGCQQNQEGCTYQITNADGLNARINIIPNSTNNGNTNGCSCCRRR